MREYTCEKILLPLSIYFHNSASFICNIPYFLSIKLKFWDNEDVAFVTPSTTLRQGHLSCDDSAAVYVTRCIHLV